MPGRKTTIERTPPHHTGSSARAAAGDGSVWVVRPPRGTEQSDGGEGEDNHRLMLAIGLGTDLLVLLLKPLRGATSADLQGEAPPSLAQGQLFVRGRNPSRPIPFASHPFSARPPHLAV